MNFNPIINFTKELEWKILIIILYIPYPMVLNEILISDSFKF